MRKKDEKDKRGRCSMGGELRINKKEEKTFLIPKDTVGEKTRGRQWQRGRRYNKRSKAREKRQRERNK